MNNQFKLPKLSDKHFDLLFLALITPFAAVFQGWQLLNSYVRTDSGLKFLELHDPVWHLAIMEELGKRVPPMHPTLSGESLTNYHFLSDLLLVIVSKIFQTDYWFTYFRIAPIVASLLFVLSAYYFSKLFFKNRTSVATSTTLILFGSNLAWIIPLIKQGKDWFANSFMLDQPFDLLTNIHTYFGLTLFLFVAYLIGTNKNHSTKKYLAASVIAGLLFAIKAYAGIISLLGIGCVVLWLIFTKVKLKNIFALSVPGMLIFSLLYLASTNSSQAGLVFEPGWILTKLTQDSGRFDLFPDLVLREQHYLFVGAYLHLSVIYLIKIFIYLIGNFHIRLLGLITIFAWIKKGKNISTLEIFIISSTLASLLIPLLFHQGKSAYNIVQFGTFALITTNILTILFIENLTKKSKKLLPLLLPLVLLVSLPTSIKSFIDTNKIGVDTIQTSELEAVDYLKTNTDQNSIILTHPQTIHSTYAIIPGLAGRHTYFSAETFGMLLGIDPSVRISNAGSFFSSQMSSQSKLNFLSGAKIDFIYLNHPYSYTKPEEIELKLTKVFSNEAVTIYQTTND